MVRWLLLGRETITAGESGADGGGEMTLKLKKESEALLRSVLSTQRPELLHLLDSPSETEVSNEQLDELRQIVTDEFSETGLREDDEPNSRGLLLENLIDELGRLQS